MPIWLGAEFVGLRQGFHRPPAEPHGRGRTTPTATAAAAAQAYAQGDLNPDTGDYRQSELLGNLDAGINSASSVVSLVRSIDPCADIVAELARGYE